MKQHFLTYVLVLLSAVSFSQGDSTQPAYKRFPSVPPIQILLSDSATMYTKAEIPKNKPVLIMLFSPECEHCRHETEEMIVHRNELKDIEIIMITMHPLWMMKGFISKYGLTSYSNIVIGKDIYFFTPTYFAIHNLPFLAMYNKNGDLIDAFEGAIPITKVIEIFNQNK